MKPPFTGLIAAPFTPFHADGSLHLDLIEPYAAHLIQSGVKGVFVCGTTGEGASLTIDERQQVAARWRQVAGDQLAVIIHVGHDCQANAMQLAAHAAQIGASAIGCIAPCFFKPATATDLAAFLAPVAAQASTVPFYYYHIPAMSGGTLKASEVLSAAAPLIPNLAGVKFTHEDLMDFGQCLSGGQFDVLFGRDEMLMAGLSLGAKGAVGSTYNFAAPLYLRMMEAFEQGDAETARKCQAHSWHFIQIMLQFGGLPAGKAMMRRCGLDYGPVRPPLRSVSKETEAQFEFALQSVQLR